jgi:hypothetical protein
MLFGSLPVTASTALPPPEPGTPGAALAALVMASAAGAAAFDDLLQTCKRGRAHAGGFPFGNPVSIERRHVPIVAAQQYWAAAKTDGIRVAIGFCGDNEACGVSVTEKPSNQTQTPRQAIIRTRAGVTRGLTLRAPAVLFKGTLLDAELAMQNETPVLLVFDVAMFGGVRCDRLPLHRRLEVLRDICAGIGPGVGAFVPMVPKDMVALWKWTAGAESHDGNVRIPTHDCPTDGVILTPENEPCADPGTAYSVFKVKPVHTLDLWFVDDALTFGNAGDMMAVASLRPTVTLRGLHDIPRSVRGCVVEMAVDAVTDTEIILTAMGCRPDKTTPNNAECVWKTLASAADVVTLADVMHAYAAAAAAGTAAFTAP